MLTASCVFINLASPNIPSNAPMHAQVNGLDENTTLSTVDGVIFLPSLYLSIGTMTPKRRTAHPKSRSAICCRPYVPRRSDASDIPIVPPSQVVTCSEKYF